MVMSPLKTSSLSRQALAWRAAFWVGMVLMAALAGYLNGWGRVDKALMDQIATLGTHDAPDDVVIVAIDDRSVAALGRWPWRRKVHAEFLRQVTPAQPRAIAMDLLFSEADAEHPEDDWALASAMQSAACVVLPMQAVGADGGAAAVALPQPGFLQAAFGVGHGHLDTDDDGVVRGVYLEEGSGVMAWRHWVLTLLMAGGEGGKTVLAPTTGQAQTSGAWWRDSYTLIPYGVAPGRFQQVSYIDVLEGRVPSESLRGRYLLVGVTALGLGMAFPTPLAGPDGLMPGVEIAAQLLDGVRRGEVVRTAKPWENALFCALPMLLAALMLYRLPPRAGFWSLLGLMGLTVVMAWWMRMGPGIHFAPLAALVSLVLVYPLWTWVRLEAVVGYLAREFQELQRHDRLFVAPATSRLPTGDVLDRHMQAMAGAVHQLQTLQRFVHESLDSLADAVLVTDEKGRVLFGNAAAARQLGASISVLLDQPLDALLSQHLTLPDRSPLPPLSGADQPELATWPVRDAQQNDLLLKCVARRGMDGRSQGLVVSLVDLSAVQKVQRQREETLRFLSHDMRAPQSAILTLLELHRLESGGDQALAERIAAHARRTLALADNFVQLTRAQSDAYERQLIDLKDVVVDAADRYWDEARARQVDIVTALPVAAAWCLGDRELLTRAVGNLIENALKYGPRGEPVEVRLCLAGEAPEGRVRLSVIDRGPGIALEDQPRLFEQFKRLGNEARTRGAGLGLSFVQAVVHGHQGSVRVISAEGQGTEFCIDLPGAEAPPDSLPPEA